MLNIKVCLIILSDYFSKSIRTVDPTKCKLGGNLVNSFYIYYTSNLNLWLHLQLWLTIRFPYFPDPCSPPVLSQGLREDITTPPGSWQTLPKVNPHTNLHLAMEAKNVSHLSKLNRCQPCLMQLLLLRNCGTGSTVRDCVTTRKTTDGVSPKFDIKDN